jgi:plastocyanin
VHHRVTVAFLAAAALVFAACGGSSPTPSPASTATPPSTAAPASAAATSPESVPSVAASQAAACQPSSNAATVSATIKDFAFSPEPIKAKVGDAIQWTNNDSTTHTVTLDDGSCDAGRVAPGKTATLVFSAPGTYTYHCAIHSTMKGTIKVTG